MRWVKPSRQARVGESAESQHGRLRPLPSTSGVLGSGAGVVRPRARRGCRSRRSGCRAGARAAEPGRSRGCRRRSSTSCDCAEGRETSGVVWPAGSAPRPLATAGSGRRQDGRLCGRSRRAVASTDAGRRRRCHCPGHRSNHAINRLKRRQSDGARGGRGFGGPSHSPWAPSCRHPVSGSMTMQPSSRCVLPRRSPVSSPQRAPVQPAVTTNNPQQRLPSNSALYAIRPTCSGVAQTRSTGTGDCSRRRPRRARRRAGFGGDESLIHGVVEHHREHRDDAGYSRRA